MKKKVIFELNIKNINKEPAVVYTIIWPHDVSLNSEIKECSISKKAKKDIEIFLNCPTSYRDTIFITGTIENKNGLDKSHFEKVVPYKIDDEGVATSCRCLLGAIEAIDQN